LPDGLAEAARDLDAIRTRAEEAHHQARLVEIWALTALVCDAQGHDEAAFAALERSLSLATGCELYRTFIDLGPAMESLLRRTASRLTATPLLERLRTSFANRADRLALPPGRALSALTLLTLRECDVLNCLGRRLSYQEIADELFISPGTVKRHVGSIYSKFGVGNRRQALLTAQSMGWQPET
jgi:LuxR family maltose regulon positive regulatory protein